MWRSPFVHIIAVATLALALVSYLVLHRMSGAPQPALQPGQMAGFLQRSLLAMFAFYGQFVVPAICLVGALVSYLKRKKRQGLANQVTTSTGAALGAERW